MTETKNKKGLTPQNKDTSFEKQKQPFNVHAIQFLGNALPIWAGETDDTIIDRTQGMCDAIGKMNPQDAVEGMLMMQMTASYSNAMRCLNRANNLEQTYHGRDMNLRYGDKLMRLYNQQMETLMKYRGKGAHQKMTVKHVHIHDGGQAIVGNLQQD